MDFYISKILLNDLFHYYLIINLNDYFENLFIQSKIHKLNSKVIKTHLQ